MQNVNEGFSDAKEDASPLIRLEDIHKSYPMGKGWIKVLNGVDIILYPRQIMSIVGASGAGKSTLLHIIGAIDRPTEGNYFYKNREISTLSNRDLALFRNKKIGFVFQFHHLLPEFTALENVLMPMMIAGENNMEKMKHKALDLLSEVGLGERYTHKPSELSGGEQQRVAIARALANDPELLLADEPTGNLDTHTSHDVFALMIKLNHQRGMSMILATHNIELTKKVNTSYRLQDGIILH